METKQINQLKIKINELENAIIETEAAKKLVNEKEERIRKHAIFNTCFAGACHLIGGFIHPGIVLGALLYLFFTITPLGIMLFRYEDKGEAYQKQIDSYKDEIKKAQEEIEYLSNNHLENIPVTSQTRQTQTNLSNTPEKKSQKTKTRK